MKKNDIIPEVQANRFHGDPYLTPEHILKKPLQAEKHNKDGEVMDPVPMAPPLGYRRTPTLFEQVQEALRIHKRMEQDHSNIRESVLEADDFNVEDEEDHMPESRWELGREPSFAELIAEARRVKQKKLDDAEANRVKPGTLPSADSAAEATRKAAGTQAAPEPTPPSPSKGGSS